MDYTEINRTKVLVCQCGARHRYAIARLLERAGMLAALYTDSCAYSRAGKIAGLVADLRCGPRALHSLARRVPYGVPAEKVFSSDRLLVRRGVLAELSSIYKRWGLQGASIVYSMYGEEAPFLEWAKSQGAKIIVDVFIHPATNRIVFDEQYRLGWQEEKKSFESEDSHSRKVFALADALLCPSEWVANGIRDFCPELAYKVKVVPYGSSLSIANKPNQAKVGRVLFAGREPLRKGLHHLAEAAEIVRENGVDIEVHVAGVARKDIDWIRHADQLNCLGKVPMERMRREYAEADLLVLPSLSEGQAGVLLEAMALGVPVVATRESGVDFADGCGITVPVGDPTALAKAIQSVVSDRKLRQQLAEGALRQAVEYSFARWQERLVRVVKEVVQ